MASESPRRQSPGSDGGDLNSPPAPVENGWSTSSGDRVSQPRSGNVGPDLAFRRSPRFSASPASNGGVKHSFPALRRSPRTAAVENGGDVKNGTRKRALVGNGKPKGVFGGSGKNKKVRVSAKTGNVNGSTFFVGEPVPEEEARRRWPHRFVQKAFDSRKCNNRSSTVNNDDDDEDEFILNVKCHYLQANVVGCIFNLGDCAYVKGEKGKLNYIGKILEFFETITGEYYVRVQWFFRAEDTVMKEQAACHDTKRLFYSDLQNDNLLDCIVSKVRVIQIPLSVELKPKSIPSCYYYYDMKYSVEYSTFQAMEINIDPMDQHTSSVLAPPPLKVYARRPRENNLSPSSSPGSVDPYPLKSVFSDDLPIAFQKVSNDSGETCDLFSSKCSGTHSINDTETKPFIKQVNDNCRPKRTELSLLDLYSGCGGMSTGLCLGAQVAGINLVTRWAVDFNKSACQSLKLNHPETEVRNEKAGDFFQLLKEWNILCKKYVLDDGIKSAGTKVFKGNVSTKDIQDDPTSSSEEFEVSRLLDICYGDPDESGKHGLKFKVRWKGYDSSEDTWEPIDNLSNCEDRLRDFIRESFKSKLLPLPGDVDVVCGGPPCQGISGYNRYRNFDAPLEDERNRQIAVFMDIVQFLKPKYVLMENVVDILKFAKGTLARYALSRLVYMNYQARLGIIAAGCYGIPQFRMRVFLWGSHPYERLPPFPLPTHEVILKGGAPVEFERNLVGYNEGQPRSLEKALVLEDSLSDLPAVTNQEAREHMPYGKGPETEFQKYIRTPKSEMLGTTIIDVKDTESLLYDHRPLQQNEDDYQRVCQIPRRKGANFRDLPGVVVGADNIVQFDPKMERVLLPSGKPLVPDYAMNFWEGKSVRPFGRLWWDDIIPTVLTMPDTHSHAVIHPEQDRVLTIRECARLQGFPDYYRFCGTIKERYCQIGNAVAVSVGRALGYAMVLALLKQSSDEPLFTLPPKFSQSHIVQSLLNPSNGVQA